MKKVLIIILATSLISSIPNNPTSNIPFDGFGGGSFGGGGTGSSY
jgi:hypothetical protein